MGFSDRIYKIRKEKHLSQEKFGELVSVSQRTVAAWESGDRMPSLTVLASLSDTLQVSVDYLIGDDDPKNEKQPTVNSDDGLRALALKRVQALSDPALGRVLDFLDGLQAGQEIAAAPAAAPDPEN